MKKSLAYKIIESHLVEGKMIPGEEIAIKIDQTLTQDSTGTMAYLQLEAMGVDKVKTKRSVAYIDHNTLQTGFENADDHAYITSVALSHGVYVSKPGNGICHQVHLERFGAPGMTLLGSDSHTPTAGGLGMLAIGAGGLDVAVAMGGGAYHLLMPEIINIELRGGLVNNTAAKDVILEVLRILSVKGGVGKIIEYSGEGVQTLSVPERATITNMGAELGATTSIFPSDHITKRFLIAQGREQDFLELKADEGAHYDHKIVIDLSKLEPLAACPHSPDNIKKVSELKDIKVDQVCIGSCTNSSYLDMMRVAAILKGKTIAPNVSLTISPGSKQVLSMLAQNGALYDMINAGARILESACGPCIGMGQAPKTDAVSVRTFNRNFYGRSGTKSAQVYLVSAETAALTALHGHFVSPKDYFTKTIEVKMPEKFLINDNLILKPEDFQDIEIVRGPNIKPFPINTKLTDKVSGKVLLKMEDNITTDHIMPSDAKLLPFRSNIPYLSEYCLTPIDSEFPQRAKKEGGGFLVAGNNYGQGSSREHAALVPLYLGIKGVLALSFARIHRDNLINNGILPLEIIDPQDYQDLSQDDELVIENAPQQVLSGKVEVKNITKNKIIKTELNISERAKKLLVAGGLLNSVKNS
ncbi:MAG TPA: aconitate hydratase [Clostridiales bacterium]|nr:aconitate hydratase [Clostridiales bacterium]